MGQRPGDSPFGEPGASQNIGDEVRSEVFGTTTALNTTQENTIDALGDDAFFEVSELGKWYAEVDDPTDTSSAGNLPAIWNELFKVRWVQRCLRAFRSPADSERYEGIADRTEMKIRERFALDWGATAALADDSISVLTIRKSALSIIVRQRTPFYPPIELVDRTIREEFVKLWEERRWEFTKRNARFSITSSGTVCATDATGGGLVFDGFASHKMWIKPASSSYSTRPITFLDSNRFAEAAAFFDGRTGRPRHFHDFDEGDIKRIAFIPSPDATYTAFGIIYIAPPQFNPSTGREGLKLLPVPFRTSLRDFVVARMMHISGREDVDASRALEVARAERNQLAAAWDHKGASRFNTRPQIDRRWWSTLQSRQYTSIVGSLG